MMLSLINRFRLYAINNFVFLLFFAMLLFAGVDLWARAGGGGGYSGGGGHSGGGRSSGGGDGGGLLIFFYLIQLAIRYPVIGVPILILAIVIFFYSCRGGKEVYVTRTIRSFNRRQNEDRMSEQLGLITGRDPGFSQSGFEARGAAVFLQLQQAWGTQDMTPVRTMVSDGIFERFSLQLQMMHDSQLVNKMADVTVKGVEIVLVESNQFFDSITLKIDASATDCFIDRLSGKIVHGNNTTADFTEYWTFIRRPGAKTVEGKSLADNNCPNCGAELIISDRSECPTCKSVVNSGDYDWVLTEITQAEEWQETESRDIVGLPELLKKDPSFNINHIEDRVSVMFYRYIAAQFFADGKYVRKLASTEFMAEYGKMFKSEDGLHCFFADAAIGCVEAVEVMPEDDTDQIRVKVKWSGHREKYPVPGLIVPNYECSRIFNQEFVLVRKSGVQSSARNILNSVHCPNCGAPETLSAQPYCEYCHTPLNDGSHDWVLLDIQMFGGYPQVMPDLEVAATTDSEAALVEVTDLPLSQLNSADLDSMLACAASMMLVDGEIDPEEYKLLKNFARARNYDETRLQQLIASVKENTIEVKLPEDRYNQDLFLRCMILMCLADGKVTSQEMALLKDIGAAMGLAVFDVQLRVKEERNKLYRQAKGRNK